MKPFGICLFCCLLLSCSTTHFYVVRHAEKETSGTMTADVPLSEKGAQQAIALKDVLARKNIQQIFSTNYNRTKATAKPLSDATGVRIELYDPADTLFIKRLKSIRNKNVLIVGHSNTVDDMVNTLTGKNVLQNLPDSVYGDLFIIRKQGKGSDYSRARFGL